LMRKYKLLSLSILAALIAACGGSEEAAAPASKPMAATPAASQSAFGNVSQERLENAENEPEQWLTYGGSYNEQRFSRLDQINVDNADQLGLAWWVDIETNQDQESTPLFVDGVIYFTES
ncbi:MAG: PQQ-dependent dehydrogenase, methanol/ethanol family, partial [Gammaproteobacteria bacterium]